MIRKHSLKNPEKPKTGINPISSSIKKPQKRKRPSDQFKSKDPSSSTHSVFVIDDPHVADRGKQEDNRFDRHSPMPYHKNDRMDFQSPIVMRSPETENERHLKDGKDVFVGKHGQKRRFGETELDDGRKSTKKGKISSKASKTKSPSDDIRKTSLVIEESTFEIQGSQTEKNKKITDFFRESPSATSKYQMSICSSTEEWQKSGDRPKTPYLEKESYLRQNSCESKENGSEGQFVPMSVYKERMKEKESEINSLRAEVNGFKQKFDNYSERVQAYLSKKLLEVEQLKREKHKAHLMHQRQRLGEYVSQRDGTKFVDLWVDGTELREVKHKLAQLANEKDELEQLKMNLKTGKNFLKSKPSNTTENPNITNNLLVNASLEIENYNLESRINGDELTDSINSKLLLLSREEVLLKAKREKLEHEKFIFTQEYKRQVEEDHCRFGKENKEMKCSAWPILVQKYQFLSLIGKGGFSEVYKCFDLEEMREVACKIHQINSNWNESNKENYVKHALRESQIQTELNHPNIVKLFHTVEIDQNSFCTVLEYCEGPDLSQYLKQHKCIPEKEAKVIIRQTLSGLKYLSDFKPRVIHYDLKPQNIIFHKGEVKISDFGLCKILDNNESRCELTSQGVGTYWYLPPETFLTGEDALSISSKVDVWALGVIFFEMLFGQKPFGNNISQDKILKEQIILKSKKVHFPEKPAVSKEAKDFIAKCLVYNEKDRYDVDQAYSSPYFARTQNQQNFPE